MASRQRSFFDQNPPKKNPPFNRPRIQRTWSANDAPRPQNEPPKETLSRPLIAASVQAKTKLKSYQFVEGGPPMDQPRGLNHTEKENAVEANKVSKPKDLKETATMKSPKKFTNTTLPAANRPPSTPSTRLPLGDLVGNAEKVTQERNPPASSPGDHIVWRHEASSNSTPVAPSQKGRKRARSSSPLGSSQTEPPVTEPSREPFDLQNIQETLTRTPQADPAADMWSRYAVNAGSMNTPMNNKGHAIAQLIADSSPHSSVTASGVSGLRRWASCGTEWPTSKAKRRRVTGIFRDEDDSEDVFSNLDNVDQSGTKLRVSRIGRLVEKMQETLDSTPKEMLNGGPSSSSPLPDRRFPPEWTGGASPLHKATLAQNSRRQAAKAAASLLLQDSMVESEYGKRGIEDFGEDPFALDEEMANQLMDAIVPEENSVERAADNAITVPANPPILHVLQNVPTTNQDSTLSDDSFGLDDDDFGDDFERLASMYDAREEVGAVDGNAGASGSVAEPTVAASGVQSNPMLLPSSDDEFGSDILGADDYLEAEAIATQALQTTQTNRPVSTNTNVVAKGKFPNALESQQKGKAYQRFIIKQVVEGQYQNEKRQTQLEKVLVVEEDGLKLPRAITLRQSWYTTPCTPGSFIHVIGEFTAGQCIIDDNNNMLILHPDHLISATVVADSFSCMRRAVLQDRVKATSGTNISALYGTILHELFQEVLQAARWDMPWLVQTLERIVPKFYESILDLGSASIPLSRFIEALKEKLPMLQGWMERFVRANPEKSSLVNDYRGGQVALSINKLLDVEEHIWSPTYGLKGNVDATVQVMMREQTGETRTLTVPLELKTGRNTTSPAHRAQTALYTLLLSDRYDIDVMYGILYYLDGPDTTRIHAIRSEIRQMIIQRNELACFIKDRLALPPMLQESRLCNNCYAKTSCLLYHKLAEDGQGEYLTASQKQTFDELVKGLNKDDQVFFKKWDLLITKEESESMKLRKELWTMLSGEREKVGRCFSNVAIEPGSMVEQSAGGKINKFKYSFIKPQRAPGFSFTESQLRPGEPVVVSDEQGHYALANGYVLSVRKHRITVAVDRRLHNARIKEAGFDAANNQTFAGIMNISKSQPKVPAIGHDEEEPVLYRLDKDEFNNGMATVRNNILQLMDNNVYKARELRSLIIGGNNPEFRSSPISHPNLAPLETLNINSDQRAAIKKVLSATDYSLVLGMPGTGKTTTIAHIIRTLVAAGKSVLLTSYTHTAVDNILLKIRDDKIGILRLGAVSKILPEVQGFVTLAAQPADSIEELQKSWLESSVVATTCLGISHPLFNRRMFDYCIVDEASQITLPVCLGPLRMAKTFVLVGDHYQLPPLVQNKEARGEGLEISLFKSLSDEHPEAVVSLEHQYRMCSDIMLLANTLIYSGRLKCGNETVATRSLHLDKPAIDQYHASIQPDVGPQCHSIDPSACFLSRILNHSTKVIFLNTDNLTGSAEASSSTRIITNPLESRLVAYLSQALLSTGLSTEDLGVITFYRSQLALLRSNLRHVQGISSNISTANGVDGTIEMHTADKFQGRDKEAIIVSCVRSNSDTQVGELLKDWRRINVAITRARSKLIIVGSAKTLGGNTLLQELLDLCKDNGWWWDITDSDLESHCFDGSCLMASTTIESPKYQRHSRKDSATRKTKQAPSPIKSMDQDIEDLLTGMDDHFEGNRLTKKATKDPKSVASVEIEAKVTTEADNHAAMPIELDADFEIDELLAGITSSPLKPSQPRHRVSHKPGIGRKPNPKDFTSFSKKPNGNSGSQSSQSSKPKGVSRTDPTKKGFINKGKVNKSALLAGRPVLRDIVNGAL